MRVILALGTKKGLFLAESDEARREWEVCGPLTSGTWAFYGAAFTREAGEPVLYGGGASNWYGPAVWRSADLGQTWTHSSDGLSYGTGHGVGTGDDQPDVTQVWRVVAAHGALYAGVEPAGLFKSLDRGATWAEVAGLRAHPSRLDWRPSNGGLSLHAVTAHPTDPRQLWVGISAGGILCTADGGATWHRGPSGDTALESNGDAPRRPHPCVHALALAAHDGPIRLYQQNHAGVFRSDDGGDSWQDVTPGLPSGFGFPLAVHPRDGDTVYVVPLESEAAERRHVPRGRMAIWRTRDAGATWAPLTHGLPQERAFFSVLRGALATDTLAPAGVYAGTTTGQLYWSADEGDTWRTVPARLPPIYAIATALADD